MEDKFSISIFILGVLICLSCLIGMYWSLYDCMFNNYSQNVIIKLKEKIIKTNYFIICQEKCISFYRPNKTNKLKMFIGHEKIKEICTDFYRIEYSYKYKNNQCEYFFEEK